MDRALVLTRLAISWGIRYGRTAQDLPQTVQGVLVHVGVPELLQHRGQNVIQGPGAHHNVK